MIQASLSAISLVHSLRGDQVQQLSACRTVKFARMRMGRCSQLLVGFRGWVTSRWCPIGARTEVGTGKLEALPQTGLRMSQLNQRQKLREQLLLLNELDYSQSRQTQCAAHPTISIKHRKPLNGLPLNHQKWKCCGWMSSLRTAFVKGTLPDGSFLTISVAADWVTLGQMIVWFSGHLLSSYICNSAVCVWTEAMELGHPDVCVTRWHSQQYLPWVCWWLG